MFDLGVGNGVRNKVAECIANNDYKQCRAYISNGYVIVLFITSMIAVISLPIVSYIDWQVAFNTEHLDSNTIKTSVMICLGLYLINMNFSIVNQIFHGLQKTSYAELGQLLSNIFILLVSWVLYVNYNDSLIHLSIFYGLSFIMSSVLVSVCFYRKNEELRPRVKLYNLDNSKALLSIGSQFFVMQIAVLIIFTTDRMLIANWLGASYVPQYDVMSKLFMIFTIAASIILTPLHSACTDAYSKREFSWIKNKIRNLMYLYVVLLLALVVFYFIIGDIISIWIGNDFFYERKLAIAFSFYIALTVWNNIFSTVINSMSRLRLGVIYAILGALINIPLSYFFSITLDMGVEGVVWGTIVSISLASILSPIQVYFFIYKQGSKNDGLLYSFFR
jgi:O-antigen/teichoic acid export membrane protein